MRHSALLLTAAVVGFVCSMPANGSSDMGGSPNWKLAHRDLAGGSDMAIIGPGNDTRTNMLLLFSDRNGGVKAKATMPYITSFFDWYTLRSTMFPPPGEGDEKRYSYSGSRCDSNTGGSAAFIAAVKGTKELPEAERAKLISMRENYAPNCEEKGAGNFNGLEGQFTSAHGKVFASYLMGTDDFYRGDYLAAKSQFGALSKSDVPWVKETSTYMLGRTELNRALDGAIGEWGEFDQAKTDKQAVASASAALSGYIKAYPNGRYTASAQGLMRRVLWLGGQTDKLGAVYSSILPSNGSLTSADLAEEIDLKLMPWVTADTLLDPALLTTIDLKRMRSEDDLYGDDLQNKSLSFEELQSQRSHFSSDPALFEYLLATHHFYVGSKPKEVLRLIPDAAKNPNFSYLDFSRQMLRGMALEAVGDRNAREFWVEMIGGAKQPFQRGAVELAIAMHDERSGQLGKVFDAQSQIKSPAIREILLSSIAGPDLLRSRAKDGKAGREGQIALYTLLYKSLTRGNYRDFVADVKMVPAGAPHDGSYWGIDYWADNSEDLSPIPLGQFVDGEVSDGYACPKLNETALALSLNPNQPKSLLCLGDFQRLNGFDDYWMNYPREKGELGSTKSLFPGTQLTRQAIYQKLIADPSVNADDKAYALFRAVWCYGPSGYNSCGGEDVPAATRKGWHDRLKRDYPTSKWAKSLKYYW